MKGMKSLWTTRTMLLLIFLLLSSGCERNNTKQTESTLSPAEGGVKSNLSGTIVMTTNRVDLIENGTFQGYINQFKERYPEANVEFEGLSNYASDILVKLSTKDVGDVLLLPVNLPAKELDYFFEPLDKETAADERFLSFNTYEGKRYGLSTGTTTVGIVYNKRAFEEAGISAVPQTLDDFYEACAKLKQAGITPLYMNYGAVWPLREWGDSLVNYMTGNPDYLNNMVNEDDPWQLDNEWGKSISIARNLIAKGYVEEELFSNNWEISKTRLAKGQAGMYLLGSWTVGQVLDVGASPDDIGFFPFPYDNSSTHYAPINPDWFMGVSKYSKNKELAMAWLNFFVKETSYRDNWGFLPADSSLKPVMPQFREFLSYKPKLIYATVQSDAFIGLSNNSKISFWSGEYIQELLAAPDLQKSFDELNEKWKEARAEAQLTSQP